jgi:hypothetical protein
MRWQPSAANRSSTSDGVGVTTSQSVSMVKCSSASWHSAALSQTRRRRSARMMWSFPSSTTSTRTAYLPGAKPVLPPRGCRRQHQPTCTFSAIIDCSTCTPRCLIRTLWGLCGAETLTMRWSLLHLNSVSSLYTRATVTMYRVCASQHLECLAVVPVDEVYGQFAGLLQGSHQYSCESCLRLRLQHDIVMLYNCSHYQL